MARPGKKPLPTQLKIIRGTDQPCRVKKDEPKPAADKIEQPFDLSEKASEQWDKVCGQLQEAKLLTNIDVHALAMYCEAYATWIDAQEKIRVHGVVVKSKNGFPVQSPFFHVANKSFDQMKNLLVEFGMTPSSRTRVSAVPSPEDDEF